jgi:hypothetical protein
MRRAAAAALAAVALAAASPFPLTVPDGFYALPAAGAVDYVTRNPIPTLETLVGAAPLPPPLGAAPGALPLLRACPPGTYCIDGVARACPAGSYGASAGGSALGCDGACAAGFACPPGSTLAAPPQHACGNASFYCPPGSGAPTPVDDGHYTTGGRTAATGGVTPVDAPLVCYSALEPDDFGAGSADSEAATSACAGTLTPGLNVTVRGEAAPVTLMTPCVVPRNAMSGSVTVRAWSVYQACTGGGGLGDADTRSAQARCPPGSFCWKGQLFRCPPGRYGDTAGETSPGCAGACPGGFVCAGYGNTAPNAKPCGGPALYCPPGSAWPTPVDAGFYSDPAEPPTKRTRQLRCEPGHYCPGDGKQYACPAGSYGVAAGEASPACTGLCAPGYFCPAGSVSPTAVRCGVHRGAGVYCPPGAARPVRVNDGYYTVGGYTTGPATAIAADVNSTRTGQARCPPGSYCIDGVRQQCPGGAYGDAPGASTPACAGACGAGYFCPPGSTSPTAYRCGDAYLALVDVLAALSRPVNYTPPNPRPDVRNPAAPMVDPAAGYDAGAVYRLYAHLAAAGATVGVVDAVDGASPMPPGNATAATPNASLPLLAARELANATAAVVEATVPAVAAADGAATGSGGAPTSTPARFYLALTLPVSDLSNNTTAAVAAVLGGVIPSNATAAVWVSYGGGSGSIGDALLASSPGNTTSATVTLRLPLSIPWETGVRLRLPVAAVPVDSFAAVHRLLVAGGPSAVSCPPGSAWPRPAPAGWYTTTAGSALSGDGNVTRDGVAPAEPGWFAVAGVRHPCHGGTYGGGGSGDGGNASAGAATTSSRHCAGYCPAGHACPPRSAAPTPCGDGTYAPPGSPACIACPPPSTLLTLPGASDPVDADDPGARAAAAALASAAGSAAGNAAAVAGRSASDAARRCRHARHCCGL